VTPLNCCFEQPNSCSLAGRHPEHQQRERHSSRGAKPREPRHLTVVLAGSGRPSARRLDLLLGGGDRTIGLKPVIVERQSTPIRPRWRRRSKGSRGREARLSLWRGAKAARSRRRKFTIPIVLAGRSTTPALAQLRASDPSLYTLCIDLHQTRYLRSQPSAHVRQRRRSMRSIALAALAHLTDGAQIPIEPAARSRPTSRGFVPWRVSYAGPRSAWLRL
jgi:hypothetical protein